MKRESATEFLRRKHPLIKAILDYVMPHIDKAIWLALITGSFSFSKCSHDNLANQVQKQATLLTNVVEYISQ